MIQTQYKKAAIITVIAALSIPYLLHSSTAKAEWQILSLFADNDSSDFKHKRSHERKTPVKSPNILSEKDAALYKDVFKLQKTGKWKSANSKIAEIDDKVLMGNVLSQKYLHPTAYRSKYSELKEWMNKYADQPEATTIYKLAIKRGPRKNVPTPTKKYLKGLGDAYDDNSSWISQRGYYYLSGENKAYAIKNSKQFRDNIRKGRTLSAQKILSDKKFKKIIRKKDYYEMCTKLAFRHFLAGNSKAALKWAKVPADKDMPMAHWTIGITSWKEGDYKKARNHFEHLALSDEATPWWLSAGAFWAFRANLHITQHDDSGQTKLADDLEYAKIWLRAAAEHPRTFYGLLANRTLGHETVFDWNEEDVLSKKDIDILTSQHAGARILALLQIGEHNRAEHEIRKLYPNAHRELQNALLLLAKETNIPATALRLAYQDSLQGGVNFHGKARYPVPDWEPTDGWRLDKALVFAFARQESKFATKARSYVGAQGLMQIMPATASFITKDKSLRWNIKPLQNKEYNLSLGQKYLEYLLNNSKISGDIILTAIAYNAGPGNLKYWKKKVDYNKDPLFFIESIPADETRNYVSRVISNLWIYRSRLNQPAPSLKELALSMKPIYRGLDEQDIASGINTGNGFADFAVND
ncbi:MAG: lytic transglycosylase domain-containing protein [Alphaproteobacteria bacterium]|nr:lytic transglycosylase domain-containing protein [Alphaproteobacteria bacterium]